MNTKHPPKNEEVNGGNKMLLLGSSIPAIHVLQSISMKLDLWANNSYTWEDFSVDPFNQQIAWSWLASGRKFWT